MNWLALVTYLTVVATVHFTTAELSVDSETPSKSISSNTSTDTKAESNESKEDNSKVVTKKREIPDALVDRPEEFESAEDSSRDQRPSFLNEIPEAETGPILEASNLDEDAEYPNEESEDRKKRTAEAEGSEAEARSKRNSRYDNVNVNSPSVLQVLEALNQNYADGSSNEDDWEGPTAEDSDRAANAVLEALGFGPNAAKYWPEGPPNADELIPVAKIRVPFNRRPVL